MANFSDDLVNALSQNGGKLSFQQVVDLLPPTGKHKVMTYLVGARNQGVCKYSVQRVEGNMEITVTSPDYVAPVAPQSPAPSAPSGGDA